MPRRPPSSPLDARRILVRGTNWIGDLVLMSPALEAIRHAWPDAHIGLLVRRHLAGAMRPNPNVDQVLEDEGGERLPRPFSTVAQASRLRRHRFDLAILFPRSFETALVAALARIPRRVGWVADGRGPLLTHGRRRTALDRRRHHLHQFLEVVSFAGCPLPAEPAISFHLGQDDRAAASELLREHAGRRPVVAVHPGASKSPRAWHRERFAAAAQALVEDRGDGLVLLLGGPRERIDCARIAAAVSAPTLNLCGKTTIAQMAALLERSHLLLANDSGPMHLAAALGTPCVPVFGPGTPTRTAPPVGRELCRPVTLDFPCSPCRQKFFRECRPGPWGKPWCLEDLPVAQVVEAGRELLEDGGDPERPWINP